MNLLQLSDNEKLTVSNGRILYFREIFTVDPSTGLVSMVKSASEAALTAAATADQGSQVLLVEVRDSGDPPFKTTANVQVRQTFHSNSIGLFYLV